MNDALELLQHEMEVAQRALAEAEARYTSSEAEHQSALVQAETAHKQIEQAHREWMNALDAVEDPIFVHDKDFRILRCNLAYQRRAGMPFKQIIGQPYYEIFPKSHTPLPNCLLAVENMLEDAAEEEVIVGDTTFRSRAYLVSDSAGGYLYSVHALENINERLQNNQALRESERQYRRLFESAKDGILLLDAESGKVIDANPFILNLLTYSLDESRGKMLWEIGLFKDILSSQEAFLKLQDEGYIRYDDLPLETKDGQRREVEFVSNVYDVGERKVIQCNIRDITERVRAKQLLQESERQYRRLFESAKDGILLLDGETGRVTDANPFILNLLSYSLEESLGKMLWEIGLFKDIASSQAAFQELQEKGYIRYEDLPLETKEGQRREVEFVSNVYEVGDHKIIQCNIRDITERVRAKEMLVASRDLLKNVMENTPVRVFWKDTELRFLGCNSAFARDAGMSSPEEVIGKDDFQMVWYDQAEAYRADDRQVMDSGVPLLGREEPQSTPDGGTLWLRTSKVPLHAVDGTIFGILGIYEDITERIQAEKSLKLFRTLLDNSNDAIEVLDPATFRFLDINETVCRNLGYSREELLSMRIFDIDSALTKESFDAIKQQVLLTGSARFDTMHRRKDGTTFPVEVNSKLVTMDRPYLLSVVRDISERRHAEAELRESEERFRAIFDHARDGIIVMELEAASARFANRSMEQMLGYGPGELVGVAMALLQPPGTPAPAGDPFAAETGLQSMVQDLPLLTKDGDVLYTDLSKSTVDIGDHRYLLCAFRDATERRAGEMKLRRANRALQTLSAGNMALVQAANEEQLLRSVARVIVEQGGYAQATIDYAEEDAQKRITPMVWSGYDADRYWVEELSWADTPQAQLPIANAIRSGTTQLCRDIANAPAFTPWREGAMALGYVSHIALPMSDGKRVFGGLCIYSADADAFDDEEVHLLEELAGDLAYGIVTLRTRKEHEQHATTLRRSLEQSIQTIADTIEARDPYTAGHQRRVAELATAIAREMGLPEEQVNGIQLAASIHDLGKIHVPSEILAKPGKLSDIEMMLVRTHPQAGYDILKEVRFPWPIADMILQHHEKLDGSGYPQGLKGDQILTESRVLTVADIVEAISSHRPYRAALGIDTAFDEIRRGSGSEYDPLVVEACLNLFSEKNFDFSSHAS